MQTYSEQRTVFAFEFADLINNAILMSNDDRTRMNHFKMAMRNQKVLFEDINAVINHKNGSVKYPPVI